MNNIYQFTETDFDRAWTKAIGNVFENNQQLIFGSKEYSKKALDSCQTIILHGNAIQQIQDKHTHPAYKFGGTRLEEYCKEFTREYVNKQRMMTHRERFDYVYADRIWEQMERAEYNLQESLKTNIKSNFIQMTTWKANEDGTYYKSSPCLQRIWMQWYENGFNKMYDIDLHLDWRSRDLWGAWQSNIIAIVDMLNREIFKPNNCQIARIVDRNDSLHIYEYDLIDAMNVIKTGTFRGV